MMALSRNSIALSITLLGAIPVWALDWHQSTLEANAAPFQKTVTLTFDFKNSRARPIHLLDLQTSCSCLSAKSNKSTYPAGESGQIIAEFSAEEPPGIYERHIMILTDESPTPQRLTVKIVIPELAQLTPRSVEWRLNEKADEQSVELHAADGLRIEFTKAIPSNDSFIARIDLLEKGRSYRLILRPNSTAAVANAAIRIYGHDDHGHEILLSAYANVR